MVSLPLTTSLGCLEPDDDTAEIFSRRVDGALYRAKAEGRKRLVLAAGKIYTEDIQQHR